MFSYCTVRYTRTHTCTQNSNRIMNVSTNVKKSGNFDTFSVTAGCLCKSIWRNFEQTCFHYLRVKIMTLSGLSNVTEMVAICEFQARWIHLQSFEVSKDNILRK